jgi:hypothetical protein
VHITLVPGSLDLSLFAGLDLLKPVSKLLCSKASSWKTFISTGSVLTFNFPTPSAKLEKSIFWITLRDGRKFSVPSGEIRFNDPHVKSGVLLILDYCWNKGVGELNFPVIGDKLSKD